MADRPRLDSWKEIASHLGRDVRTVIRWERNRGLPVYRVPGGKLSRVFAYPGELDQWLAAGGVESEAGQAAATAPRSARSSRRWIVAAAIAGVAAAGVIGWGLMRAAVPLRELRVVGNDLRAVDAAGRTRWTHSLGSSELEAPEALWTHVGDADGDGQQEIFAAMELRHPTLSQHAGALTSFSPDDGRARWSVTASDRLRFGDGVYGPPWAASGLTVYRTPTGARVAWALHHFTWWPGLLMTLDADGRRLGSFVNSGWIRATAPSRDGRPLLMTGIANSQQAYVFAVLDAANPSGHSPEPPGSRMECLDCPAGGPLQYVVFPRTDVSHQQPFPGPGPTLMTFDDGSVHVHALESSGPNIAAMIYEFAPDLTLRGARFSDSFWEWHRRLEADGKIRHSSDECPERGGLEVRHWAPENGWTTLKVPVQ